MAFAFAYTLFSQKKSKTYGLKKENYISVSLALPTPTVVKKVQKKVVPPAPVISEVTPTESKNVDVNNLFSDVWTKKIVKSKEKPPKQKDNRRLLAIEKKLKTTQENSVESLSKKIQNIESSNANSKSQSASTADEVNEYLAKIQAIVYKYFHVPPNSAGNSVKSVIELNALGKVIDFRILTYSANDALNQEADKIKERIRSVVFPVNPEHKSSRTVVILISKE